MLSGIGNIPFVSFEGRVWHAVCFSCRNCSHSLVNEGFLQVEGELFCPHCAEVAMEADRVESNN